MRADRCRYCGEEIQDEGYHPGIDVPFHIECAIAVMNGKGQVERSPTLNED